MEQGAGGSWGAWGGEAGAPGEGEEGSGPPTEWPWVSLFLTWPQCHHL